MNCSEKTRLHLEALGSRVVTRVARRSEEGLTVSQALPFLKLESGVRDEAGRVARIKWVSVDIEGDTPQLVMELAYERPTRQDDTIPVMRRARRDDTVPFEIQRDEPRREVIVEGAPASALAMRSGKRFGALVRETFVELRRDLGRFFLFLGHQLSPA